MKKYKFRCEETGKIVYFPFEVMMKQKYGFLDHKGKTYRRVHEERHFIKKAEKAKNHKAEIVSDTLGFGQHQFQDFEADRKAHGFTGVEFVRDKDVPQFFQVKVDSVKEWKRYIKHRNLVDKNGINGGKSPLSRELFEQAKNLVARPAGPNSILREN